MKKIYHIPNEKARTEHRHYDVFECRTAEGEFGCQCCCIIHITMNPTNDIPPDCMVACRTKAHWLRVDSNVEKDIKLINFG